MSNQNLVINLQNPDTTTSADFWIKLFQEEYPDETITLGETAELLDEMFGIESCSPVEVIPSEEPITEEEFAEKISADERLDICNTTVDFDFLTVVRVYVSDFAREYKLVWSNAVAEEGIRTTSSEQETLVVEKATSAQVTYPAQEGIFTWITCIPYDNATSNPEIKLVDGSLEWEGEMTGSISASYSTLYDSYEVTVFGETDEYKDGSVLGFYVGLVEDLTLSPPSTLPEDELKRQKYCGGERVNVDEPDKLMYCYKDVHIEERCQCEKTLNNSYILREKATCPSGITCGTTRNTYEIGENNDGSTFEYEGEYKVGDEYKVTYVDCNETTGDINNPEFYELACCYPPEFALPECSTVYTTNPGGKGLTEAKKQEYYTQFGINNVVFEAVSPEDGDCGRYITKQSLIVRNCCDAVEEPLAIDKNETAEVLPPDGSIIVYTVDGRLPITFHTSDSNTYFTNGEQEIIVNGHDAYLYANDEFCGTTEVTVADGCSTDSVTIRSTEGQWIEVDINDYADIPPRFGGITADEYPVGQHSACSAYSTGARLPVAILGGWKFQEFQCQVRGDYDYPESIDTESYLRTAHGTEINSPCGDTWEVSCDTGNRGTCLDLASDPPEPTGYDFSYLCIDRKINFTNVPWTIMNPDPANFARPLPSNSRVYVFTTGLNSGVCGQQCNAWGPTNYYTYGYYRETMVEGYDIGRLWKWTC